MEHHTDEASVSYPGKYDSSSVAMVNLGFLVHPLVYPFLCRLRVGIQLLMLMAQVSLHV